MRRSIKKGSLVRTGEVIYVDDTYFIPKMTKGVVREVLDREDETFVEVEFEWGEGSHLNGNVSPYLTLPVSLFWDPSEIWKTTPYSHLPWVEEPDLTYFFEEGYPVAIFRQSSSGHLCGYVGVPENHPLFGLNFQDSSPLLKEWWEEKKNKEIDPSSGREPWLPILREASRPEDEKEEAAPIDLAIDVHGGLTYANSDFPHPFDIVDWPVWVFGFDCGHSHDVCPHQDEDMALILGRRGRDPFMMLEGKRYRDIEYVEKEVRHLAKQLKEVEMFEVVNKED